ncbi:MAG: TIM barrel protein [Cyclobacteriaceae bacterium]|nr:TIM barrel protein [Cyclobacteriaceae bacterium]
MSEIHAILRQIIPELEQSNIRLAIENHDRFKAREFREIIDKAYSSFVGICLDPANSLGADEGFETVFETLRPVTINFHLKDYTIRRKPHMMGFDIVGTPAGQGKASHSPRREYARIHWQVSFHDTGTLASA